MFASKNILKFVIWLTLFGVFLGLSLSQAQQTGSSGNRRIERLGDVATDEWEMDLALPGSTPVSLADNTELVLPDGEQNQKLQQLLSDLAANPGDTVVHGQLEELLAEVLLQANSMVDTGDVDQARQLLSVVQSIAPGADGFSSVQDRLRVRDETAGLLTAGIEALESRRILEPKNNNALFYFKQALSKDPQSKSAQLGLVKVQEALIERALESAGEFDFDMAAEWLLEATTVRDDQTLVANAQIRLALIRQAYAVELERKVISAMDAGDFSMADFRIIDLIAFGGQEARVELLRARLKEARFYGGFGPGQVLSDELLKSGGHAPQIVIIAAGSFLMGSKEGARDANDNEKPRHRVTIEKGFGLGIREVSVAEFRLFIERSGYRTAAERSGSSSVYDEAAGRLSSRKEVDWEYDYSGKEARPDLPVLHVNLYDAQAYVQWLTGETGKAYRLPSEAEYEYVARAGNTGSYWWGEGSPEEVVENLTGDRDYSGSRRQWTTGFRKYGDGNWGPAAVGSLLDDELVHPMGVHDIAGNVSEWTEDCWHQNYIKAPLDGSAWVNPGCKRRVVRGGYWASSPRQSRAASRLSASADTHGPVVGIRIARDL